MSARDMQLHSGAFKVRTLPRFGVFALAADGVDLSVIAKALDIRCAVVKLYIEEACEHIFKKLACDTPVIKRPMYTMATLVATLTDEHGRRWFEVLEPHDQLAVIETRAYFRAFENRPRSVEN